MEPGLSLASLLVAGLAKIPGQHSSCMSRSSAPCSGPLGLCTWRLCYQEHPSASAPGWLPCTL